MTLLHRVDRVKVVSVLLVAVRLAVLPVSVPDPDVTTSVVSPSYPTATSAASLTPRTDARTSTIAIVTMRTRRRRTDRFLVVIFVIVAVVFIVSPQPPLAMMPLRRRALCREEAGRHPAATTVVVVIVDGTVPHTFVGPKAPSTARRRFIVYICVGRGLRTKRGAA